MLQGWFDGWGPRNGSRGDKGRAGGGTGGGSGREPSSAGGGKSKADSGASSGPRGGDDKAGRSNGAPRSAAAAGPSSSSASGGSPNIFSRLGGGGSGGGGDPRGGSSCSDDKKEGDQGRREGEGGGVMQALNAVGESFSAGVDAFQERFSQTSPQNFTLVLGGGAITNVTVPWKGVGIYAGGVLSGLAIAVGLLMVPYADLGSPGLRKSLTLFENVLVDIDQVRDLVGRREQMLVGFVIISRAARGQRCRVSAVLFFYLLIYIFLL